MLLSRFPGVKDPQNPVQLTDQVLALVLIIILSDIFGDFSIGPDIRGTDISWYKYNQFQSLIDVNKV